MSWIASLSKVAANLLLDAAEELARRLVGGDTAEEAVRAAILKVKREGLEAMADRMELAAANERAALGMPAEADKLISGTINVVEEFEIAAGRRTVPTLNFPVEMVDELPAGADDFELDTPIPGELPPPPDKDEP
jgi:hypothetical protein